MSNIRTGKPDRTKRRPDNFRWLRLYAEFATDAKVQSMPEAMQRRLIMLFCLRACDVTVTLCDDELAFQLRITGAELAETKALFIKKGFVNKSWNLLNWDKRQCKSDSSAARTSVYRSRKNNELRESVTDCDVTVTSHTRHGDVTVTPYDRHGDCLEENRIEKKDSSLRSESYASSLRSDAISRAEKKSPQAESSPAGASHTTALKVGAHTPLTQRAVKRLVAEFQNYGKSETAAEIMIANGRKQSWAKGIRGNQPKKALSRNPFLATYLEDYGSSQHENHRNQTTSSPHPNPNTPTELPERNHQKQRRKIAKTKSNKS